tara:strand:- start:222 stop:395 length:174 start_codon:yes stop_codon:yes gene_type:complete
MKSEKIKKSLKNAQDMLNVIIDQTLRGNDEDLLVWKKLNEAIKSIEDARTILHKSKN